MSIAHNVKSILQVIAKEALDIFQEVAGKAQDKLNNHLIPTLYAVANTNTSTINKGIQAAGKIHQQNREVYELLAKEPAIARVVAIDENNKKITYYISRGATDPISDRTLKMASYRSPIGRIASAPIGEEVVVNLSGKDIILIPQERTKFFPLLTKEEWDSRNSVLERGRLKPITVVSLRDLLEQETVEDYDDDALERLLAADKDSQNVMEGLRRSVITKMGLRDQPILDQYQDEIFRLPLDSRLLILGAPGTGKTTTLIRRLGQKLDVEFLADDERRLVTGSRKDLSAHEQSWVMFTPTELLKQYVKEAFARENIPASDQHIKTWLDYRRELGRNVFGVLRTGSGSGVFIMKDSADTFQAQALTRQIDWFSDFDKYQTTMFWEEIKLAAQYLRDNPEKAVSGLGGRLFSIVEKAGSGSPASIFVSLDAIGTDIQKLLSSRKESTDKIIQRALNLQFNRDERFIDALGEFISTLTDVSDDAEDLDADEEEESNPPKAGKLAAAAAYRSAVRAQARVMAQKKTLGKSSRNGKIIAWLGDRSLTENELLEVGNSLLIQSAARRFVDPVKRYVNDIPKRYRGFRRLRQNEKQWYQATGFNAADINPLELDIILLAVLRNAGELIKDPRISSLDHPLYAPLKPVYQLYKNQVLVDEATDFSPIQLACMAALTLPGINSFFACGDFNQRITTWGSRSENDIKWVFPNIIIKSITVSYRQSRKLNEFARQLVFFSSGEKVNVALPEHVDNEGVAPVIALTMSNPEMVVAWLKERIIEIEASLLQLPSIAILVNGEENVGAIAKSLNEALIDLNIRVVPCPNGQVVGQENDVRVFDVQHIKGLEFEAVFFIGIDELAHKQPDLFDKYLYVGTTRAATYLGITCAGKGLPAKMAPLEQLFAQNWK